ncbi:MAG: ComEC/Rec2 family competence protein [Candidatus Harrisonbacteria bacterium]|nr:ComEC/Rec2 family competence protein [Candidatus Harrisonbacteria bacterium]
MAMVADFALEALLGFLAGAAAAAFHAPLFWVLAGGACAALWLHYLRGTRLRVLYIMLGTLLFGFGYYAFYTRAASNFTVFPPEGIPAAFEGIVVEEPRTSSMLSRFTVELQEPYRGKVTVVAPARDMQYGDLFSFRGSITEDNGTLLAEFPHMERTGRHRGNWLKEHLVAVKRAVMRGYEQVLPPDHAALLSGITLGARSTFSKELKEDMAVSGTLHIVAVSGYNISVLAANIGKGAAFFVSRRIAIWISVIGILLFVGMVGTEASVVRAALMGIAGLLAEGTGRPRDQAYAIAAAAALMLAWDPTILREDLGFLLSFLSLLGVTYMGPALRTLWHTAKDKGFFSWKENVDTTLGAQMGVLPVLLTAFGSVSLTSVFANILIIPFIPVTMGLGFVLGVTHWLAPFLAFPLAEAIRLLTSYEIGVIHAFAQWTLPVSNFFFSPATVAGYYLLLAAFIARRKRVIANDPKYRT